MELKNIFQMTKTDRYTQDGRDELAKLQETEDVKYKTGDISQKTGLQKQPDGSWAPPKKGARSGAGKPEAAEGWTETRMASGKLYDLKSQGKRIIEQYDPETETKTFKLRDLNNSRAPDKEFKTLEEAKAAAGSTETKQEYKGPTNPDHDEILQKMKSAEGYGHVKNIGDYEVYRVTSGPEKGKYKVSLKGSNEEMTMSENQAAKYLLNQKRLNERSSQTEAKPGSKEEPSYEWKTDYKSYLPKKNDELRKMYHKESDPKIKKAIKKALQIQYQPESFGGDSAPRILTGDTKIRIKK